MLQVRAIETKGNGIALQFEHPTIAGTTVGGWMNRADKIPVVCNPIPSAYSPVHPSAPHTLSQGHNLSLRHCCSYVPGQTGSTHEASLPLPPV